MAKEALLPALRRLRVTEAPRGQRRVVQAVLESPLRESAVAYLHQRCDKALRRHQAVLPVILHGGGHARDKEIVVVALKYALESLRQKIQVLTVVPLRARGNVVSLLACGTPGLRFVAVGATLRWEAGDRLLPAWLAGTTRFPDAATAVEWGLADHVGLPSLHRRQSLVVLDRQYALVEPADADERWAPAPLLSSRSAPGRLVRVERRGKRGRGLRRKTATVALIRLVDDGSLAVL